MSIRGGGDWCVCPILLFVCSCLNSVSSGLFSYFSLLIRCVPGLFHILQHSQRSLYNSFYAFLVLFRYILKATEMSSDATRSREGGLTDGRPDFFHFLAPTVVLCSANWYGFWPPHNCLEHVQYLATYFPRSTVVFPGYPLDELYISYYAEIDSGPLSLAGEKRIKATSPNNNRSRNSGEINLNSKWRRRLLPLYIDNVLFISTSIIYLGWWF